MTGAAPTVARGGTWRWTAVALLLYLVMIATLLWGLQRARSWALRELSTAGSQADWDRFRDDVARQVAEPNAPVRRRVPESVEPPALVLLRDHYRTCLVISVVLSSTLFLFTAILVRGALASSTSSERAT